MVWKQTNGSMTTTRQQQTRKALTRRLCMEPYDQDSPSCQSSDPFESLLSLEASFIEKGYEEGYSDGIAAGKREGRDVGLKAGFEIGEEIGFYKGCVLVWEVLSEKRIISFSSRVKKLLTQLQAQLLHYPLLSPEAEDIHERLENIRLKFKALCLNLGIKPKYPGMPKTEESTSLDF